MSKGAHVKELEFQLGTTRDLSTALEREMKAARAERDRYRLALEAIRSACRYFNSRGTTHHETCEHAGCMADRALRGES